MSDWSDQHEAVVALARIYAEQYRLVPAPAELWERVAAETIHARALRRRAHARARRVWIVLILLSIVPAFLVIRSRGVKGTRDSIRNAARSLVWPRRRE